MSCCTGRLIRHTLLTLFLTTLREGSFAPRSTESSLCPKTIEVSFFGQRLKQVLGRLMQ
jgi:hypothetical protein